MTNTINILVKERKALHHQRAKKDYIIARLRVRIASLEQTVKDQETQLKDMEKEGEDIQGDDTVFLSDDDDYEEDDDTELEDYEFLEADSGDFIPVDDEEEPMIPDEE